MGIASSQAGQVLITFLQTKHTHKHFDPTFLQMLLIRTMSSESASVNLKRTRLAYFL